MSLCHAVLRGVGEKVCLRESVWGGEHAGVNAGVSLESRWGGGVYEAVCDMVVYSVWRAVWPKSVCDVAVPCGFARRWRKVRLRESVALGGGQHAGVNAACRWGAGGVAVYKRLSCARFA